MANNGSSGDTAFVLAGGGSLGAIQVGMLRELVTHGVRPNIVVGSSVEALNGAYFAADRTAAGVTRLEAIWRGLRRQDIFPVTLRRVAGLFFGSAALVDSRGLRRVIEQHLPYRELEHAAIPMHIAATELLSGASVELSSGSAVEAILASCAIPAAFAPVRLGNDYLIDGAIASNTPIMTAVKLGASRLVVLPTGFACSLKAPPATAIASALHSLNLLIAHQLEVTIVFPQQANASMGLLSVLTPVGTALLGLAVGQSIIWPFPDGTQRCLRVLKIIYQPEADDAPR